VLAPLEVMEVGGLAMPVQQTARVIMVMRWGKILGLRQFMAPRLSTNAV